jgi:hypothetical protein
VPSLARIFRPSDTASHSRTHGAGLKKYLGFECLVHLVRLSLREDDDSGANAVRAVLMSRCEAILRAKILDAALSNAAAVRKEIVSQFGDSSPRTAPRKT